ncbi:MAG: DUF3160 domain-containing protein, partial [Gemmatimonadaceae bacterium]
TPDGRGVVGLISKGGSSTAVVYAPIAMPLADVINAWQFSSNACEDDLFARNAGLFRPQSSTDQLYSLYERASYTDGYDSPLLVTTDLFWENFSAAFNGVFILLERRHAAPAYWSFVTAAASELERSAPGSQWERLFSALAAVHRGELTGEAERIATATKMGHSDVLDTTFDFSELKPRGHYTASPESQLYFRSVHYLTEMNKLIDPTPLATLPADVATEGYRLDQRLRTVRRRVARADGVDGEWRPTDRDVCASSVEGNRGISAVVGHRQRGARIGRLPLDLAR